MKNRIARRPKKRAKSHHGITPRVQPFKNARECFDSLGAIATGVVQQNNTSIATLLFHPPQDDVSARFRPILRIDAFQNHEIVEVFSDLQPSQFPELRWSSIS